MDKESSFEKIKDNKDKMEFLKERGIVSFHIGLTAEETNSIDDIRIETQLPQFNFYGSVKDELIRDLTAYLNRLGTNSEETINSISKLVARISDRMIKDFSAESAWVMVRISLPSNEYKLPRWHTDGSYFKSERKTYKLVMAIKGIPSRFGKKIDVEKFERLMKESGKNFDSNLASGNNPREFEKEDIRIRKELMLVVKEVEPLEKGHAAMYLIGDKDAVVHSEPQMDETRIFMSVVVGSQDQINELKERSKVNKK